MDSTLGKQTRISAMHNWVRKLPHICLIGGYAGIATLALGWIALGFRYPDLVWDAFSASSPASVVIAILTGTVASALSGALCALPIYFVYWLLLGRFVKAMRRAANAMRHSIHDRRRHHTIERAAIFPKCHA